MKNYIFIILSAFICFSCEIDEQVNPNNPSINTIVANATRTDLNNIVSGSLAQMRVSHNTFVTASGTLARELYVFDADPRNRTDLLGIGLTNLDNNSFYTTAHWSSRYRTIKNLNILLESVDNAIVSDTEKEGYRGFANTLLAHQFLMIITSQGSNGLRLDVTDPQNLGPIVTEAEALAGIRSLLDMGLTQLSGSSFIFNLSDGFDGFDTPTTFAQFNRAVAARAALYAGNNQEAINLLGDSFMALGGDLSVGPKMSFSNAGGDLLNGLFKVPGQNGDQIIVNNGFLADAEAGDTRVANKTIERTTPSASNGITGTHSTSLFASATAPIDIIRNEELILILAEAQIQLNTTASLNEALDALNIIRNDAGLPNYSGTVDQASLIDEMLVQRRYSLWGEGHRMVDLRRYNRLTADFVPVDLITEQDDDGNVTTVPQIVFTQFPIPATEN